MMPITKGKVMYRLKIIRIALSLWTVAVPTKPPSFSSQPTAAVPMPPPTFTPREEQLYIIPSMWMPVVRVV